MTIRRRKREGEPQTAAELVPDMLRRLGGRGRVTEHAAFDAYRAAVGEMLRGRSEPERLRDGTLHVRVASSALAHELVMLRAEILARMAAAIGPGIVTEIRTRVGDVNPG